MKSNFLSAKKTFYICVVSGLVSLYSLNSLAYSAPSVPRGQQSPAMSRAQPFYLQQVTNPPPSAPASPTAASPALETTSADAGGGAAADAGGAVADPGTVEANFKLEEGNKASFVGQNLKCDELGTSDGTHPVIEEAYSQVQISCESLMKADQTCQTIFENTNKFCHTEKNENIASSITMIQSLMSVASGVANACDNFGKAMDLAKQGMALYTTGCGAAQVACNMKCAATAKELTKFQASLKAGIAKMGQPCISTATAENNPSLAAACGKVKTVFTKLEQLAQKDTTPEPANTIVGKVKVCSYSVPSLLGTAVINIGSLIQSKMQSDQCKKDAEDEAARKLAEQSCQNVANKGRADCACSIETNKNLPHCLEEAAKYVDCGKPENADKTLCICKANPRLQGCEGVSTALATNSNFGAGNGTMLGSSRGPSGSVNTNPSGAASATNQFPLDKKGNGTDGSSTGGGSGSSAGLSGSGGGAAGNADAAEKAAAGLTSANILESGGGGGGGFRGGFGGGGYSSDYRNKLKAYGNKNGIAPKLAGNGWAAQVTSTGGRSNFDKVKTRYQENKLTLIGGR